MTHYQSDLFHDARWLSNYLTDAGTFYWIVREWGTHIGDDAEMVGAAVQCGEAILSYRIDVTVTRGSWSAEFSEFAPKR